MNAERGDADTPRPLPGWPRLHAALMPDYNRKATIYWWSVVLLGLATLGLSIIQLAAQPPCQLLLEILLAFEDDESTLDRCVLATNGGDDDFQECHCRVEPQRRAPEIFALRDRVRGWRFYDHFRTDSEAPARLSQIGTRTPVLSNDGRDVAAAIQTIYEIGDSEAVAAAVKDAFPGSRLRVDTSGGRFTLRMEQRGLLRPLDAAELSDGTLRYILWIAVLLTPRPPELMVLNEPETSLHPDLLAPLGRLIGRAARETQVVVVAHEPQLVGTDAGTKSHRGIGRAADSFRVRQRP